MTQTILTTPTDLFTVPAPTPAAALLPLQVNPALPTAATLAPATGMLLPQPDLARSMAHFPEQVYDTRPTSHLSRFCAALLGDAGVGQLRRRQMVARITSVLTGTAWLDQDRFWGAIFSLGRGLDEQLPIDPADQVATVEEWDAMEAADASYRERLIALAASVPLAGTLPGLIAAASAIIGAPVEATETWKLLDSGVTTPRRTWGDVRALGTWHVLNTVPWFELEFLFTVGLSGVNSRAEVVVRPHKTYTDDTPGMVQAASDAKALAEVLSRLVPAGILVTVDSGVDAPGVPVTIAACWADSAYTHIAPQVSVSPGIDAATAAACYPLSAQQASSGVNITDTRFLPVPYGVTTAAASWDFNAAVTAVTSYSFTDTSTGLDAPGDGTPADTGVQTLLWRDGSSTTYTPDQAVAAPALAAVARLGSPGHLAVHPWSGSRQVVPVHA